MIMLVLHMLDVHGWVAALAMLRIARIVTQR